MDGIVTVIDRPLEPPPAIGPGFVQVTVWPCALHDQPAPLNDE